MSTTTGEILPVASGPWVVPENQQKEVPSVAPVTRTEGGSAAKTGDPKVNTAPGFSFPSPEFPVQPVFSLVWVFPL